MNQNAGGFQNINIERMVLNYKTGISETHFSGRVVHSPIGLHPDPNGGVDCISFSFASNLLDLILKNGKVVTAEIENPRNPYAVPGEPVVYLDQNYWSAIARRMYDPESMRQADRAAADRLIELGRSKKIILPLSSAHLVETSRTFGEKRQNLATTILELSHGWIMRHPLRVRQVEIIEAFSRRYGDPAVKIAPVFTLDHDSLYPSRPAEEGAFANSEMPLEFRRLMGSVLGAVATYETLLDPERMEREESSPWVEHHHRIAQALTKDSPKSKNHRDMALMATISDNIQEISIAATATGMQDEQLREWFEEHRAADLASMPFLGLYADTISFRLSDSSRKWRSNDLFDGLFICCSTAYADAIGADRATADYVSRSWKNRPGKPPIASNLTELVELVEKLIDP